MRVRQIIGAHAGEIVTMPYHIAMRALASGSIELLDEASSAERDSISSVAGGQGRASVAVASAGSAGETPSNLKTPPPIGRRRSTR